MSRILITGVTGFLGRNIAVHLIDQGYEVAGSFRSETSQLALGDYKDKILWLPSDYEENWTEKAITFMPDFILHAAWIGVKHEERNDWLKQFANVGLLERVLKVAAAVKVRKIVCLGSQAEYGYLDGCVTEDSSLNPKEAYAAVKIVCSNMLGLFCDLENIDWYWLRLFSFIGKGESGGWLIPTVVRTILTSDKLDLTPGEQKYAYLPVEDLAYAIELLLKSKGGSGVYNISSSKARSLRSVVERIRDLLNPAFQLNFGKIPYRRNQQMLVQGNTSKFVKNFGNFERSDFETSLLHTVQHLKELTIKNIANESF